MEVQGTIKLIGETQTFGNNGFRKREVVLTTEEQYPQQLLIEFVQDKVTILDKYSKGQDVTVSINLRGREWVNPQGETKYFNSIQGWRIEATGASTSTPKESVNKPPFPTVDEVDLSQEQEDDLPF